MVTFSDVDIKSNILNIGRKRERMVYYRPDGSPTLPLPADAQSRIYYLSKGFTIKPNEKIEGVACPMCEFVAKDAFGLQSHLRIHVNKEKSNKEE